MTVCKLVWLPTGTKAHLPSTPCGPPSGAPRLGKTPDADRGARGAWGWGEASDDTDEGATHDGFPNQVAWAYPEGQLLRASVPSGPERASMLRSVPGPCYHPWRGLYPGLGREVPAPARTAEIGTFGARAAAIHIPAAYGSHRKDGGPTVGVRDFRTIRHVDLPRLVARGGLISCPVRGSRLTTIGRKGT